MTCINPSARHIAHSARRKTRNYITNLRQNENGGDAAASQGNKKRFSRLAKPFGNGCGARVVRHCMARGHVGFAINASVMEADTSRYKDTSGDEEID